MKLLKRSKTQKWGPAFFWVGSMLVKQQYKKSSQGKEKENILSSLELSSHCKLSCLLQRKNATLVSHTLKLHYELMKRTQYFPKNRPKVRVQLSIKLRLLIDPRNFKRSYSFKKHEIKKTLSYKNTHFSLTKYLSKMFNIKQNRTNFYFLTMCKTHAIN